MNEKTKVTLTNLDTWKRGLFMVVFAMISGVAKLIVTLVAIFQFVTLLFKGQTNKTMIPFGQNLSTYLYQITLFLTFKTDHMPFPFLDFPDGAPESNQNEGNNENIVATATNTKDEIEVEKEVEEEPKKDASDDSLTDKQ